MADGPAPEQVAGCLQRERARMEVSGPHDARPDQAEAAPCRDAPGNPTARHLLRPACIAWRKQRGTSTRREGNIEMGDPVIPGPCPESGCPAPTEIDCIQVTKVYDFCFQTETREGLCFDIPSSCGTVPPGSTATGSVTSVTCTTQSVMPIPGSGGFANVTLLVTVIESFTITSPSGTKICTFSGEFSFFKTITLCAPKGVTITCEAPATSVGPCVIMNGEVCCVVNICLLIEAVALVKILVPTFGFCVPAPCVVAPSPPFACPPSPLFPPQCPGSFPTTTPTHHPEFPEGGPLVPDPPAGRF